MEHDDVLLDLTVAAEIFPRRHLGIVEGNERRAERGRRGGEQFDVPVTRLYERDSLALAFNDQTDGGTLHTPG
jgi:hypothetical protein